MLAIRIKLAPRDIARLHALLEGHDGLGLPRCLDARAGELVWEVPLALGPDALAALRAARAAVVLRAPALESSEKESHR